uniref:Uncharacterized protein n=1 Tax=Anopheles atroparvus TaxID=41427 RepID=A0AAG5DQ55_ANOAO
MSTVVVTTVVVVEEVVLVTEILSGIAATVAAVPLAPVLTGAAIVTGIGAAVFGVGFGIAALVDSFSSPSNSSASQTKVRVAPARPATVVKQAVVKCSSSASNNSGGGNNQASGQATNNSGSGNANGDGSRSSNQSGTENAREDGGDGAGDDGDKDRKGDGRKNQHEKDKEAEIEEIDKENEAPEKGDTVKRRKVITAWLEIPLYPEAPARPPRAPEEEKFIIRLKLDKIGRLQSPGENGFYPRQHLLARCRMLFYGYGRLMKLCKELGVAVNDICMFGNSVYKDLRATKVDKLEWVHAAHVFPITDFDFKTIRERLRQVHPMETQEQINRRIVEIETILKNMVGQTDFVYKAFNESGSVGRALDDYLRTFIQAGNRNINLDNVGNILESLIKSLRRFSKVPTENEIEATVTSIESANRQEWIDYYNMGLNGVFDDQFNVSRRTIEPDFKEVFKTKRSKSKENNQPNAKDEENKGGKKNQ